MVLYFAYGSNMDKERMKKRVNNFKIIGNGILKKHKLVFNKPAKSGNGVGFANVEKDEKSFVEGIVYETDNNGIEKLDYYEGVPEHYHRKTIFILVNSKLKECEIYIASKTETGLKPTKEYLNHLLEGEKFLSKEYFKFIKDIITLD